MYTLGPQACVPVVHKLFALMVYCRGSYTFTQDTFEAGGKVAAATITAANLTAENSVVQPLTVSVTHNPSLAFAANAEQCTLNFKGKCMTRQLVLSHLYALGMVLLHCCAFGTWCGTSMPLALCRLPSPQLACWSALWMQATLVTSAWTASAWQVMPQIAVSMHPRAFCQVGQ